MAIIIFSVLIVGGRFNIGGKESTFRTLTPTPEIQPTSPPEGSQPDPTTAPLEWSITYKFLRCEGNLIVGNFVAVGDAPGYIKTEIKNPDGSYDFSYNGEFLGGTKEFGSPIHPGSRARTSPWRAQLYSGGQLDGIMWSDGELKTTLDGVAFTQCS